MKEIYDWVPWFRELAEKIADGGERDLIDKAKRVAWSDNDKAPPLLRYGDDNIDPLSFFYTLASRSTSSVSRKRIYSSIDSVFGLRRKLAHDYDNNFIFPTPPPVNTLFHRGEGTANPELLWNLFRDAVSGLESVSAEDFEGALDINNVSTRNLTQVLFHLNNFLPIDDQATSLGFFDSNQTSGEKSRSGINRPVSGLSRSDDCRLELWISLGTWGAAW